jgi:hypothetical protein
MKVWGIAINRRAIVEAKEKFSIKLKEIKLLEKTIRYTPG